MKKRFFTLLVLSAGMVLSASAQDDLALVVPEIEPVLLTQSEMEAARPHLTLSSGKGQQTLPNTISLPEPVLPTGPNYKFMDDMTFVGVPLFVAGIIAKGEKKAFRQDYNNSHANTRLITHFKTSIDDYTQYFSPALTLGLKVGGVEGRSDWKRLLVSSAMSYGIMAALVNSIKYTASEMRPDGSTANSWPSGHTATSFVGATILHKEYGLTRSPWYSVAGYGVATATGVMRVLNNRHWVSDVLSGAGIGIFSGELAYALSDLIYKNRHLLRGDMMDVVALDRDRPSFFDVSMGIGGGSKEIDFDRLNFDEDYSLNIPMKFGSSTVVQAEGAYFFSKYVGLGGRLRVRTSPVKGWNNLIHMADNDVEETVKVLKEIDEISSTIGWAPLADMIQTKEFTIESDHLTEFSGSAGLYFNLPLSSRFALGTKLLIGRSIMQSLDINARFTGMSKQLEYNVVIKNGVVDETQTDITGVKETGKPYDISWDYLEVKGSSSTSFGTGLSLTYAYKTNFCWKVFFDYDHTRKDFTLIYNPNHFITEAMPGMLTYSHLTIDSQDVFEYVKSKYMNQWVLGASFSIHF
ncbi:MAG: phosphatase PAP2 family protein [Bacteroidaceae bacterium]|nr:phosphatase PAP2 family protein [Bacteroidaceae bacterium]